VLEIQVCLFRLIVRPQIYPILIRASAPRRGISGLVRWGCSRAPPAPGLTQAIRQPTSLANGGYVPPSRFSAGATIIIYFTNYQHIFISPQHIHFINRRYSLCRKVILVTLSTQVKTRNHTLSGDGEKTTLTNRITASEVRS
jgi:hypothetical protein